MFGARLDSRNTPYDSVHLSPRGRRYRKGMVFHQNDQKTNVVRKSCNETWMSNLEGRVAQAFESRWHHQTAGCPVPSAALRAGSSRFFEGRESEMPAPGGFDDVSTNRSNSTRSIAAHPCKKTQGWGNLGGNGACKDR